MKKLSLTMTCIILIIALTGGTTVHAISSDKESTGESSEALSQISIFAGSGQFDHADGDALSASFRAPYSIVTLPDGRVLVSDSGNQKIRSIHNGEVSTYAGISFENDEYGIPLGGWSDGVRELSAFSRPSGMAADDEGNVYIADADYNLIRKISKDGEATTIAGNGFMGAKDGEGTTARFAYPQDIAIAKDGTLYVADTLNHAIRKITAEGKVSTLNARSTRTVEVVDGSVEWAGDYRDGKIRHAKFNEPSGLAIDSKGNLYVSDAGNQLIRYIDFSANTVTTVAGDKNHSSTISQSDAMYATGGYSDGNALEASFNFPKGLVVTKENGVIIADSLNHSIRYLIDGHVTTIAGDFHNPTDVAIMQDGSLMVADSYNNMVRQIKEYTPYINLPNNNYIAEAGYSEAVDGHNKSDIPREALIEEVKGVVHIRRAGGAKEFRAFAGISLYNGDHIRTAANSSVIIRLLDTGDQITVDNKAWMYISDLRNKSSNKITKLFVWSGSIWVSASTLENSDDKFDITTTTAVMSIRGTTLLVGVDPATGESRFFIASGLGKVSRITNNSDDSTTLNPGQSVILITDFDDENLNDLNNIVYLESLLANTSSVVIEAIIANKKKIDMENEDYMLKLLDNDASRTQEEINRINQNLDNLIGNILNKAIEKNIVSEEEINRLIQSANEASDNKFSLENTKLLVLSDSEKAKQEKFELLEAARKKKQEEAQSKRDELKKQNEELKQKLQAQLEKQKQEKEKAAEAAKQKAEEEFKNKLTSEAAKLAIEARMKAKEEVREMQQAIASKSTNPTPTPPPSIPDPAPVPAPNPDPVPAPNPDPDLPVILSVKSIMDFTTIEVEYGASQPNVPKKANIVLSDDSEVEIPILWSGVINVNTAGMQSLIGKLDLSGFGHVSPTDLTATFHVIVKDAPTLTIESIIAIDASTLTVKFAGLDSLVITLTASLTHNQSEVTFTYAGKEYNGILETPWEDQLVVDQLIAADIDREILELPSVSEIELDDELKVVAVRDRYFNLTNAQQLLVTKLSILESAEARIADLREELHGKVIEVAEFDTIYVNHGASPPELPKHAILILDNNSEVYVPVDWLGGIDVNVIGIQTISGTMDISDLEQAPPADLNVTVTIVIIAG